MYALVLVELLTPDPNAMTARTALRDRLGFRDLVGLRRRVCLELSLPAESGTHAHMLDLLQNSIVLANPNKESATLADGDDGIALETPSALVWDLLHGVGDAGVDAGLAKRVARVCPPFEGITIRRATLWTPTWSDRAAATDASELIRRAALGEGGSAGLLANPHANGCEIVYEDLKPGDVSRLLSAPMPA